jgi:hypothetical protein
MNQEVCQEVANRLERLRAAPRCGARNRAGTPCQCPAIRGRSRRRLHGGLSPGAPRGEGNGNFKDGYWTADALEERRWVKDMLQLYAKGGRQMTAKSALPNTSVAKAPARRVRVRLRRVNCDYSKPYPPDGESKIWWNRLQAALGTTSSDFVNATLIQIQNASRLPCGGVSEMGV